jgi:ATP-dependent DNA helicase RecQ
MTPDRIETHEAVQQHTLSLLQQMIGVDKNFRPGQWEAIEAVAIKKQRVLVVQRTGWGKSLVYFLATKLLREEGAGPTLLISPLLSLMRNQIEAADRIGIRAFSINSGNRRDWKTTEDALTRDECDIVLISPERLASDHFNREILPQISKHIGLFVVDEAHCISDWGHDFRPDYRRIGHILQSLPKDIPVLGTTATANQRVVADVQTQFGSKLTIFRGSLARESLRLQNLFVGSRAERLAWLVENLGKFKGSGIIYCQTVQDTERVTQWLKHKGFNAEAYHAQDESEINRPELEAAFMNNKIDILVATVALGMGFDKPDIAFIIHFQRPSSVTHYYQQVGRAGRGIDKSYGILLCGDEDEDIQKFLIGNSIPAQKTFQSIITVIPADRPITLDQILAKVNYSSGMVQRVLRLLEVDGIVSETREGSDRLYYRTQQEWRSEDGRIKQFTDLRWKEWYEINRYVHHRGCLMDFLQNALNDSTAHKCDRCANCQKKGFSADVPPNLVIEAEDFLKECQIILKPKERVPAGLLKTGKTIPANLRNAPGQSLSYYGDVGWGKLVKTGKYQLNYFSDELVTASAHLILNRWRPDPFPQWIAAIPSRRHPSLVPDLAQRLATSLNIPFFPVLERCSDAPEQKTMMNETMQAHNVLNTLAIHGQIPKGPVLLIDDIIDSGWTLSMAGYLLRANGSGLVYPFTLAQAAGRNSNG